jgi:hypothetical protein
MKVTGLCLSAAALLLLSGGLAAQQNDTSGSPSPPANQQAPADKAQPNAPEAGSHVSQPQQRNTTGSANSSAPSPTESTTGSHRQPADSGVTPSGLTPE